MKQPRTWILGACMLLIAGMAFLTLRELIVNGVSFLGIVSLFVVALLGIGIGGALGTPPR